MKNKFYLSSSLIIVALLLLAGVSLKKDFAMMGERNTAAVAGILNNQGNEGVKYPVTAEYSGAKTNIDSPNSSKMAVQTNSPKEYIVELTEQPLTLKYRDLKEQVTNKTGLSNIKADLILQKEKVINQQDNLISSLSSSVRSKNAQVSSSKNKRFTNVLNAIVLNASQDEVEQIKKLTSVKSVQQVGQVKALLMDSVPLINAPQVWSGAVASTSLTGRGINIAIIDTGVDYNHPDLGGCIGTQGGVQCKVAGGYDFINNDADPMDDMGHGTHVAAIAAGNGVLKGVAPDATIYAYKVLNQSGFGSWVSVIAGLEKSADPNGDGDLSDRMDIASLSLGGGGNPDDDVSRAVDNLVSAGVVVTVAAGNNGSAENTIGSPGTARNAITVAASDKGDRLASFSSRGPVMWINSKGEKKYLVKPDVTAPGVNICAARYAQAFPNGDTNCNHDGNHVAISGTSMATPHVAGEAALLLQLHRDWSPEEVKTAIRGNLYKESSMNDLFGWGYGRIDALKLVGSTKQPTAKITTSGVVSGSIDINGTALSPSFLEYKISYGVGKNPISFVDVYTSNKQVNNRVLFSNLNTDTLGEGIYTIKLAVTDTLGNTSIDQSLIEIDNVSIVEPRSNDIYKPGRIIDISGTVKGTPTRFWAEYNSNLNPNWSNLGIILTNGGTGSVSNSKIATWDTASLSPRDNYTLRLSVQYGSVIFTQIVDNINFESSLHTGWPVHVDYDIMPNRPLLTASPSTKYISFPSTKRNGEIDVVSSNNLLNNDIDINTTNGYFAGFLEPVAADLDKDGKKEVIVVKGGNPPKVQVYNNDGTLRWSRPFGSDIISGNMLLPIVGDINNDGYDEIVAHDIGFGSQTSNLYAFSRNGSELWHSAVPKSYQPAMLMSDLDHNGRNEIVVQGNDASEPKMFVVDSKTGNVINQWSMPNASWGASIMSSPSVGNFDDDKDLEIVSISPSTRAGYNPDTEEWTNEATLYVYNMDGSVVPSFPVLLPGSITSSPVTGDIDGDGKDDIVVGLTYASNTFPEPTLGGLYALNRNGQIMPGWPVYKGYNFQSTPSLSDINGDGKLEIGASRLGFITYLLDYQGKLFSGWPTNTNWQDYYSSIMADIDFDDKNELMTTAGYGVYGWKINGSEVAGFPKRTEMDAQAFASVADMMGDGKLNLFASSNYDYDQSTQSYKMRGSLYVWDLDASYSTSSLPWPTFMHDNQRTGMYAFVGTTTRDVAPSASIIGTSTLKMVYKSVDGTQQENQLESEYRVMISAGSSDQTLFNKGAMKSYIVDSAGANFSFGDDTKYSRTSSVPHFVDSYFTIPANTTSTFAVKTYFDPKKMFAGTYHGVLDMIFIGDGGSQTPITIPTPNITNALTIIGERSPYITSISATTTPSNQEVIINGVRFDGSEDALKMASKDGAIYSRKVQVTDNGQTIKLIPNVPAGDYYITIQHPKTGESNGISLTVTAPVAPGILSWTGPNTAISSSTFTYVLNWEGKSTSKEHTVFVHFVDANGNTKFLNSFVPSPKTTEWSGPVSTQISVMVPSNTPIGRYKVMAGLYNPVTGARMSLIPGGGVTVDTQTRYQVGTLDIVSSSRPISILKWTGPTLISASSTLSYTLNWQGGPSETDQRIFVHFVNSTGETKFLNSVAPTTKTTGWSDNISIPITVVVSSSTPQGPYKVMAGLYNPVTGARASLVPGDGVSIDSETRYRVGIVNVIGQNALPRLVSCSPSVSTTTVGSDVMWTAIAEGGVKPYSYYWSDVKDIVENSNNGKITRNYTTPGTKYMSIAVIDSINNKTEWAFCSGNISVATSSVIRSVGGGGGGNVIKVQPIQDEVIAPSPVEALPEAMPSDGGGKTPASNEVSGKNSVSLSATILNSILKLFGF